MGELQLIREKNPNIELNKLLRVLWHGTSTFDPLIIAQSEAGLDMRYAKLTGRYGAGIYFADTAKYSIDYAHAVAGNEKSR